MPVNPTIDIINNKMEKDAEVQLVLSLNNISFLFQGKNYKIV